MFPSGWYMILEGEFTAIRKPQSNQWRTWIIAGTDNLDSASEPPNIRKCYAKYTYVGYGDH